MRKKTVTHSVKTIFWWIIYCLPLILFLIQVWGNARNGLEVGSFNAFIENYFDTNEGLIVLPLQELFGYSGVFPVISSTGLFVFMEWFIGTYLLHLAVDFILFIPRLCHKFMNKFTRSEDCE